MNTKLIIFLFIHVTFLLSVYTLYTTQHIKHILKFNILIKFKINYNYFSIVRTLPIHDKTYIWINLYNIYMLNEMTSYPTTLIYLWLLVMHLILFTIESTIYWSNLEEKKPQYSYNKNFMSIAYSNDYEKSNRTDCLSIFYPRLILKTKNSIDYE